MSSLPNICCMPWLFSDRLVKLSEAKSHLHMYRYVSESDTAEGVHVYVNVKTECSNIFVIY